MTGQPQSFHLSPPLPYERYNLDVSLLSTRFSPKRRIVARSKRKYFFRVFEIPSRRRFHEQSTGITSRNCSSSIQLACSNGTNVRGTQGSSLTLKERDNKRDAANSKRGEIETTQSKRGIVTFRRMSSRQIDSVSLLDSGISCGVYFDRKWLFCFFSLSLSLSPCFFLSLGLFSIGLAGR